MKYGELEQGVYRKVVMKKNIMRKWNAWGLHKPDFDSMPEDTEIRLYDRDTKDLYIISHQHASEVKIVGEFSEHEPQIFIPLSAFTITKHERKV